MLKQIFIILSLTKRNKYPLQIKHWQFRISLLLLLLLLCRSSLGTGCLKRWRKSEQIGFEFVSKAENIFETVPYNTTRQLDFHQVLLSKVLYEG